MIDLSHPTNRRSALGAVGIVAAIATFEAAPAVATNGEAEIPRFGPPPRQAETLASLTKRLQLLPRRRSFSQVPFLVDRPDQWDHEAAQELLAYRGRRSQLWENSDIAAAWLNLMREAVNGQVFAHGNRDFLAVSATHGSAHLALFNQAMWDKYGLADRTGGAARRNIFIDEKPGASPADDPHDPEGFYGIGNNNIVSLQRRGVVFLACHDTVHAIARGAQSRASGAHADIIAADLTNNLIPGVILVPSIVAFLVELQASGFTYTKGS